MGKGDLEMAQRLNAECRELRERAEKAERERDEARRLVVGTAMHGSKCAYCGALIKVEDPNNFDGIALILKRHLGKCPKHPMRDVERQLAAAQARERGLREAGDAWLKEHDGEWCCCRCGPAKTNRAEWCGRGCGSDYNAMIRIDHWRMGRLFRITMGDISDPQDEGALRALMAEAVDATYDDVGGYEEARADRVEAIVDRILASGGKP